nr:hypothetical protein [Tanacetum cinerariifolium]
MDSMISIGQKNTLDEYMILSDADNRPPMLDKDLYDSWKIIIELYMQNKEHIRMILESVNHDQHIWPTIEENGVTRTKKYDELSATKKIQADCDLKATNIILQVGDLSSHTTKYTSPALIQKVFANMRRVGKGFFGVDTPLFKGMLVPQQAADDIVANVVNEVAAEPTLPSPIPTTTTPPPPQQEVTFTPPPSPHQSPIAPPSSPPQQQPSQTTEISMDLLNTLLETCTTLTKKVKALEKDKIAQALEITKRMHLNARGGIAKLDENEDVTLEEVCAEVSEKDADTQRRIEEKNKKILVTITNALSFERRRKGVVIRDPKEKTTPSTIVHSKPKSKDKGKGILVEEPKPLKKKAQIEQDEAYAREKNMMVYLKNMAGFKMDFFKGMSYDDIRPIFEKHFNSIVVKKQKFDEEVEELKKHLQIVPNDEDDVYTEATPLALKQNQGDFNDAMGLKKKTVVVTFDPLAFIAKKTKSANKKQEFVKSDDKKLEKKDDEKKRDMSKVKCYNCKKKGHFTKDCKKVKVKDYEYYKIKMLLAKKDKDEQVLLAEDQAWMESSSDSDQEINTNMVFMAQIDKVLSNSKDSTTSADDKISKNQGDVNDAMGSKKKTIVVTSDPLALIAKKTNVSRSKEKVVVSSDSKRSEANDFSKLKKITSLLAKAFNRRKFYSKPTNNNLRTSSSSQSTNKKQEFVKTDNKRKAKVKDYEYYKTKMLLAKKDKDKQVVLAEDQAWMESSSDSDQEINANMVFMAQIKKVLSDSEASSSSTDEKIYEVSYYLSESESESEFKTSEYYDNSTNYGLFVNNDDDQENFHDAIDSTSENFIENHIDSQKDYDKSDVIGLGYNSMFRTHYDEALEIEKFKRSRENKIEFAYDYGNLNASYVNEKINFEDGYFQEIINLDFEKIDSSFQQTRSLEPYVPNVILEKIIIDLEDKVVNLLEKEKVNMETIESLKSKSFESSEKVSSESENQSENDCLVIEKECDKEENRKLIAPGMFKLNVSQCVSPISMLKSSCDSNNVEIKLKKET